MRPESAEVLLGYLDVVHDRTTTMLKGLITGDLDRVVDRRWDPPVTLGVRLVSIADDCLQRVGQAAFVHGLSSGTDLPGPPTQHAGGSGQRTYSL